jgi:hypothetical protein
MNSLEFWYYEWLLGRDSPPVGSGVEPDVEA